MVEGGAAEVSEDGDHRRADVRAQGGAAAHRAHREAARGGRQAEARVRAAEPRIRRSSSASPASPTTKIAARHGDPREERALRRARRRQAARSIAALTAELRRAAAEVKAEFERRQEEARVRELVLDDGKRIDGRDTNDDPPHHVRGRRPAARARLGAVPARRDAGARHRDARHQPGRAAASTRSSATSRSASCCTTTSRRSRPARPSRCAAPAAARSATAPWPSARSRACCPTHEKFPYTIRIVSRDPRVERLVVDGAVCGGIAGADGRGRADQGAGRRHRDGPHQGGRPRRHPDRHPRRRGSPRRHGLQGLRHASRHHRDPDGHQDRRA